MFVYCLLSTTEAGAQVSLQLQQDVEEVVNAEYDVTASAEQSTTSSQVGFIYTVYHDNIFFQRRTLVHYQHLARMTVKA